MDTEVTVTGQHLTDDMKKVDALITERLCQFHHALRERNEIPHVRRESVVKATSPIAEEFVAVD